MTGDRGVQLRGAKRGLRARGRRGGWDGGIPPRASFTCHPPPTAPPTRSPAPNRIGRTGRSGKTGVATTFVNTRQCEESILLDLKHLLREAKQRVPQFLLVGAAAGVG